MGTCINEKKRGPEEWTIRCGLEKISLQALRLKTSKAQSTYTSDSFFGLFPKSEFFEERCFWLAGGK